MDVRGRKITVMGLGRHGGGVAAARWLAEEGAIVTITDQADAAALADSIAALDGVDIRAWHLGEHCKAAFAGAEIVVVNPAVRPGNRFIAKAAAAGATITSELELFLHRCPARMIGVTGSNGKSTTAAMIAEILRADGRRTFLGGNIGNSLLPELPAIRRDDWAVLEISSFQLAWLSENCPVPGVAALTSFTPNHLDWHGTVAAYRAAKRRLFGGQISQDVAVLAGAAADWRAGIPANVVEFCAEDELPELRIPGVHNRRNAACAAAAAAAAGCSASAITAGLANFAGLPHRLELVGSLDGREFYNDSMATTPESVVAALSTFADHCWLLAGGYDKGICLAPLAAAIARDARGAAFFGATGPGLHALAAAAGTRSPMYLTDTLDAALAWCWRQSQPGDVIALSPACASYDQFVDYRARGEHFCSLVRALGATSTASAQAQRDPPTCGR